METKTLRFEGVPGKVEHNYVMSISVPGKLDLLNLIEKPPFHVVSKHDTTFSSGILAFVPHSMKLRISRDYQEPFVGIYIRIRPKPDEIIEVSEVKGNFVIGCNAESSKSSKASSICGASGINSHRSVTTNNANNTNKQSGEERIVNFSFFKSSVSKLPELENYEYYESRCHWPDVPSQVNVNIQVTKTAYVVMVNDDNCSGLAYGEPTSSVSSLPYFLSDTFSDVTIQVGDESFPAHKIILSERSRYFSRMFANPCFRESQEGLVRMEDDASLFKELLHFVYKGTVENLEIIPDLYILSDRYDIPDLTSFCEKYLLCNLNIENCMEMFDLSQSVMSQGMLAKKSKETIMWNKDKFAADLQSFKEFSQKYPEIIFELLQL